MPSSAIPLAPFQNIGEAARPAAEANSPQAQAAERNDDLFHAMALALIEPSAPPTQNPAAGISEMSPASPPAEPVLASLPLSSLDHPASVPLPPDLRAKLRDFMRDSALFSSGEAGSLLTAGTSLTGDRCSGQGNGAAACKNPAERCVVKRSLTVTVSATNKVPRLGDDDDDDDLTFEAFCGPVHYELVDGVGGQGSGGQGSVDPGGLPGSSAGENSGLGASRNPRGSVGLGGAVGSSASLGGDGGRKIRRGLRRRVGGEVHDGDGEFSGMLIMAEGSSPGRSQSLDPLKAFDAGLLERSTGSEVVAAICACNCTYVSRACCWAPTGVIALPLVFEPENLGVLGSSGGRCCGRGTGRLEQKMAVEDGLVCGG